MDERDTRQKPGERIKEHSKNALRFLTSESCFTYTSFQQPFFLKKLHGSLNYGGYMAQGRGEMGH